MTKNAPAIGTAQEDRSPHPGVEGLLTDFGFHPTDRLTDDQIVVLSLTREMRKYVEKLKIPVSTRTRQDQTMIKVEREVEEVIEKTSYKDVHEVREIPADSMDVGQISEVNQLPSALPTELLAADIAPELFLKKLVDGELLRREWREPTKIPYTTQQTIKVKKIVEEPAPPEEEKQHAVVLLDISGSMQTEGRWAVARALALEFLRFGYQKRAMLAIRPFGSYPDDASSGQSLADLNKITRRLLNLGSDGGTDIQRALATGVADIKKGGKFDRADILLISDGDDRLYSNPLGDIKLHSVIVGSKRYDESIDQWSTNVLRVPGMEAPEVPVGLMKEVEREMHALQQQLNEVTDEKELEKIRERLRTISRFYEAWANETGRNRSSTVEDIRIRQQDLQGLLNGQGVDILLKNRRRKAEEQRRRELQAAQEVQAAAAELTRMRAQLQQPGCQTDPTQLPEYVGQSVLRWIWNKTAGVFRRFRRHKPKQFR